MMIKVNIVVIRGWYWLEREVRECPENWKMFYVLIWLIITQIYTVVKMSQAIHLRFVHLLYVSYTLMKRKPFMQWQPQNGNLSTRTMEDAGCSEHTNLEMCNYCDAWLSLEGVTAVLQVHNYQVHIYHICPVHCIPGQLIPSVHRAFPDHTMYKTEWILVV